MGAAAFDQPPSHTAYTDAYDEGSAVGPPVAYGDFSDISPWFANQPEFQRLRGMERAQSRARRRALARPVVALAGVVALFAVAWYGGSSIGRVLNFDGIRAALSLDASPEPERAAATVNEPVLVGESPTATGSVARALTKQMVERAPTAVGPVEQQTGNVTRLTKTSALEEPATPRFTRTVDFPSSAGDSGAAADVRARQSVLAPSGASRERLPNGRVGAQDPALNPFEGFSDEGAAPAGEPRTELAPGEGGGSQQQGAGVGESGPGVAGEIDPQVAEARTRFLEGDHVGATRLLRDVLASDPKNLPALTLYGDILLRTRQLDKASDVYATILAIDPTNVRTMVNRGGALLGAGRASAAVSAANEALTISSESISATLLLSKAQAASGDMRGAMASCERVGVLTSSSAEVEWCRAAAQSWAGNTFVGVRMFTTALNSGGQGFVRSKQVIMRDRGLYNGPIDGASSQSLIDAVTQCATASDCIL